MMADLTFTDEDIAIGPVLGPEYRASQRFAEGVMAEFQEEHLQPIIKMVADQVQDKLWDVARDWLLQDTETNVQGAVRDMVNQTVDALLTGKEWAMQRYPYADYSRGEEIRKAVAQHGGDELLMRRIADLEAEVAKQKETIDWLRR
jgi:hypothetical protein